MAQDTLGIYVENFYPAYTSFYRTPGMYRVYGIFGNRNFKASILKSAVVSKLDTSYKPLGMKHLNYLI